MVYTPITAMKPCLREYRCRHCQKLLFKGVLVEGDIEAKCKACKQVTVIQESKFNDLLCMIEHCPNRIHCPSVTQAK